MARRAEREQAKVHLEIYGHERDLEVPVRLGAVSVQELLPMARELARQISAIAVERAETEGRQVSCRAGCGACCRQIVPISPVEARSLARRVAAMPAPRRKLVRARFAEAVRRMEEIGVLDPKAPRGRTALTSGVAGGKEAWEDVSRRYFAAGIPCPFLENESCGIYEDRPVVCREYLVTSPPERCDRLDGGAETVDRPIRMSEVLAEAASAVTGREMPILPLTLSLEWDEAHGEILTKSADGEELFWELIRKTQAGDE